MNKERTSLPSPSNRAEILDVSLFYQFALSHFLSASEALQGNLNKKVFQELTGELFSSESLGQASGFSEGALLALFNYLLRLESLRISNRKIWENCDFVEVLKLTGKAIYLSGICHYELILGLNPHRIEKRYALLKTLTLKIGHQLLVSGHFLKNNENVVYFLIRKYPQLAKVLEEKTIQTMLDLFFPQGFHQAGQIAIDRYKKRNYSHLANQIEEAIEELP